VPGPGLLAVLLARQRGFDTLDRITTGPKPELIRLGAEYHTGAVRDACPPRDIVIDAPAPVRWCWMPSPTLRVRDRLPCRHLLRCARPRADAASLNRRLVLENDVVFGTGTVNANRRHYTAAVESLATADRAWLSALLTRRIPLEHWTTR
jgi:hypothetical protein